MFGLNQVEDGKKTWMTVLMVSLLVFGGQCAGEFLEIVIGWLWYGMEERDGIYKGYKGDSGVLGLFYYYVMGMNTGERGIKKEGDKKKVG